MLRLTCITADHQNVLRSLPTDDLLMNDEVCIPVDATRLLLKQLMPTFYQTPQAPPPPPHIALKLGTGTPLHSLH